MSQRIQRVNGLIKQEISKILLKEIDFSDILVTITNIDTSPDLKSCKIKIISPIQSFVIIIKNRILIYIRRII